MTRMTGVVLLLAATFVAAPAAFAHEGHTQEIGGVRKEMKASLADAGGKLVELAEAMPAAKFSWRPQKDTRSAAEVYLHVVTANYGLPMMMGMKPPASSPVTQDNFGTFEKSTTDKAKIVGMLKESFEYARRLIEETPESELDTPVTLFGMATTKRGAMLMIVNHAHEHLGQSIAYARSNNVTPPWTAREHAAAAAKKAESHGKKSDGKKSGGY